MLTGFISFSNHFAFRTYALDLGLYTRHAWCYFHGISPDLSMVGLQTHALADHFDLYLLLFSPLVAAGGAITLLVIQWLAFGAGCLLAVRYGIRDKTGIWLGLYFLVLWPVIQSAGFDYHSNVVAAMCWLLWWKLLRDGNTAGSWLALLFIWVGREDMPLWMVFSALGGALVIRSQKKVLLAQAFASAVVFFLIMGVVMPMFPSDGPVSNLGKYSRVSTFFADFPSPASVRELLTALVHSSPGGIIDRMDVRHEFWLFLLLSGGWLLIRRPAYLIMLVPVILSKMWHDNALFGGTLAHYNIPFVPVLIAAAGDYLQASSRPHLRALLLVIPALAVTIRSVDNPANRSAIDNTRFYQLEKFLPEDFAEHAALLAEIPDTAAVSAMSALAPHFSARERIYQFPIARDEVAYIVISHRESTYPITNEERDDYLRGYIQSPEWSLLGRSETISVFERRKNP